MNGTGRSLDVLHVDDPDLCALAARFFEGEAGDADYTVTTETSPDVALERVDYESFNCVVSGYTLSGMNGIEFLEAARDRCPDLPVVLFSGEKTARVAADVIRAGLTDYLRKGNGTQPYTMLVRRVGHAVGSSGRFDRATGGVDAAGAADTGTVEFDDVGVLGADGRFEQVGESYASLYDYGPQEVVGKHWSVLHPAGTVEHLRTHVLPIVSGGGQWSGFSEGRRADGSTFVESKLVNTLGDGRLLIAATALESPLAVGS